jgi:phage terminase large subunit-like protein
VDYRVDPRALHQGDPGNVADYDVIRADIGDRQRFPIREIAYDRWNATQLTTQLAADGSRWRSSGQGFASMAAPFAESSRSRHGRALGHAANPVLR